MPTLGGLRHHRKRLRTRPRPLPNKRRRLRTGRSLTGRTVCPRTMIPPLSGIRVMVQHQQRQSTLHELRFAINPPLQKRRQGRPLQTERTLHSLPQSPRLLHCLARRHRLLLIHSVQVMVEARQTTTSTRTEPRAHHLLTMPTRRTTKGSLREPKHHNNQTITRRNTLRSVVIL